MPLGRGLFFAARNPLLGLINIVPQILVIIATIVAFYRIDRMRAGASCLWRHGFALRPFLTLRSGR